MGYSRSTSSDWSSYTSTTKSKKRKEIFTASTMDNDMSVLDVGVRESRDSDANPESTAIFIGTDVTASMGMTAEAIAKGGLSTLFTEIYDRLPVTDPHIMVAAIGDATMWDNAPFQCGQFESEVDLSTKWLEKIYLEGGGGGNGFESYDLPVYFAARHTAIDCWEKRQQKGFLFTIGDEQPPPETRVDCVKKTIASDGDGLQANIPFKTTIEEASKMYHYFHIIIAQGSHARYSPDLVKEEWRELLGERAIWLENYEDLAETIISIIQVIKGDDKETVAASWSGDTSLVVANAIKDLTPEQAFDKANEVVRL